MNGHEFEQTPGDHRGQRRLHAAVHGITESETTEQLSNNNKTVELQLKVSAIRFLSWESYGDQDIQQPSWTPGITTEMDFTQVTDKLGFFFNPWIEIFLLSLSRSVICQDPLYFSAQEERVSSLVNHSFSEVKYQFNSKAQSGLITEMKDDDDLNLGKRVGMDIYGCT